jgi:hypothetical protein
MKIVSIENEMNIKKKIVGILKNETSNKKIRTKDNVRGML